MFSIRNLLVFCIDISFINYYILWYFQCWSASYKQKNHSGKNKQITYVCIYIYINLYNYTARYGEIPVILHSGGWGNRIESLRPTWAIEWEPLKQNKAGHSSSHL
jgi:hypothetical protein